MGRYFRRFRRYRRKSFGTTKGVAALLLFALVFLYRFWIYFLLLGLVVVAGVLIRYLLKVYGKNAPSEAPTMREFAQDSADYPQNTYAAKDSLMTPCEKKFFVTFQKILGSQYTVQPQINLASIINKESRSQYRSELFRNIDFGVFDQNYKLLFLIEINDSSHHLYQRQVRDRKVQEICRAANIPLITFWTEYGVNEAYIRDRFSEYLRFDKTPNLYDEDFNQVDL